MSANPLDFASNGPDESAAGAARFCSHCGQRAANKFCSGCGEPLAAVPAGEPLAAAPTDEPVGDWRHEVRFAVLARVPEVRARVERSAAQAKRGVTGEQILAITDSVVSMGVSLEKVVAAVQPVYASWGVKTGKERREKFNTPVGETLVRVLCSLARHGQELRAVDQHEDGCTLTATLPSDLCALEGKVVVSVRRGPALTLVEGRTLIEGQWMDWGKSRRRLEALFGDLHAAA